MNKANQRQNTRHKAMYEAYRISETREKNKAFKLIRHLERYPDDEVSKKALDKLPKYCLRNAQHRLNAAREASAKARG